MLLSIQFVTSWKLSSRPSNQVMTLTLFCQDAVLQLTYLLLYLQTGELDIPGCTTGMHLQYVCNPLQWRHNGRDNFSNHQSHDCLLNRLFRRISKKTSKLRVTGLCAGNSPGTGEFPAQMASYAENISLSWRHHEYPDNIRSYNTPEIKHLALCLLLSVNDRF